MAGSMLKEQILLRRMLVKEEIAMKNYIKPTAEVIELSVKESLSALPNNLQLRKVSRNVAVLNNIAATVYAANSVGDSTITE